MTFHFFMFIVEFKPLFFRSLYVCDDIALADVSALFYDDFHELATEGCLEFEDLSVVVLDVAEAVAIGSYSEIHLE